MRAFVAIPIDPSLREGVGRVQEALRRSGADVRWVVPANLHLTLKFLGEISEEEGRTLTEALRPELERFSPLTVDWEGVGRFPTGGLPRVVWVGCRGDVAKLAALAGASERAAERIGIPRERRPFSPHLTIGRVKTARNKSALIRALENQAETPFGPQRIDRAVLYRSTLTPEGPIYAEVAALPLRLAPRG